MFIHASDILCKAFILSKPILCVENTTLSLIPKFSTTLNKLGPSLSVGSVCINNVAGTLLPLNLGFCSSIKLAQEYNKSAGRFLLAFLLIQNKTKSSTLS